MIARFSSASAYVQDAFLISFLFLFIDIEARFPLVLIWLGLVFATALAAAIISWRKPYNPPLVLGAAVLIMGLSLLAGVSIGTFIALSILSAYRLHARFSELEDKNSEESLFLILFLVVLTIAIVLSIFNPLGNSQTLLLPLAAAAIIFYTVSRLFYRYLAARRDGANLREAIMASAAILTVSGAAAFMVYLLADEVRRLAGTLFAGVLSVVLWPFAGALNWLVDFINGLSNEEDMLDNLNSMEEQADQPEELPYSPGMEIDYTLIGGIGIVIMLIIGIILIRKIKPQFAGPKEESIVEINRFSEVSEEPKEPEIARGYDLVNIHEIRQAFREFEKEATAAEKGRFEHETVREWAQREELPFTGSFFKTYEKVRYSDGQIAENEAFPFLEELEKINRNFFEENV